MISPEQIILLWVALVMCVFVYLDTKEVLKKEKERENRKKEKSFIKRIHFIETIDKAVELTNEGKFEESNNIYDNLLKYLWNCDTQQYFGMVLENKWYNYEQLGLLSFAQRCLEIKKNLDVERNSI